MTSTKKKVVRWFNPRICRHLKPLVNLWEHASEFNNVLEKLSQLALINLNSSRSEHYVSQTGYNLSERFDVLLTLD